jgi:hypothetical protein
MFKPHEENALHKKTMATVAQGECADSARISVAFLVQLFFRKKPTPAKDFTGGVYGAPTAAT